MPTDPQQIPGRARRRRATRIAFAVILALLVVAGGIWLANNRIGAPVPAADNGVAEAGAADPGTVTGRDGAPIGISGRIVSVLPGSFVLHHGTGTITVEMDDWDPAYRESAMLRDGDRVLVTGAIDDDLYAAKRIEAGGVYVDRLGRWFRANPADEENARRPGQRPPAEAYVDLVGEVVEAGEGGFVLRAGGREVRVDAAGLPPGEPVAAGERLYLWGDMRFDAAAPTLAAKGLMRLRD